MFTKARLAGHPIHPMLVSFPIALYTTTVAAVIAHAATGDPFWYRAALWTNLAGIVMAAVAAIPGLVDLVFLPQFTRAKATGLRHATLNVIGLVLFSASAAVLYRNLTTEGFKPDDAAPIVLGLLGIATTIASGWLGYTMVQTHHVGVRPTEPVHPAHAADEVDSILDEIAAVSVRKTAPRHIPLRH